MSAATSVREPTLDEVAWAREFVSRIVKAFEIPVGATDALAFASNGYAAVTLGCVEPSRGMPREHHLPSDTPENLEVEKIPFCVDFTEKLFDAIVARHHV